MRCRYKLKIFCNEKIKNQKSKILVLSVLCASLFAACEKGINEADNSEVQPNISQCDANWSNIPYATQEELGEFSNDPTINDYNIVRKVALMELGFSFNETMGWHCTTLSEQPVIVYDYDSKPKLYEFIVKDTDGNPIGTVATFAKREVGTSIAFALPQVRDYEHSTRSGSRKMFIGNYPNTYSGIISRSGDAPTTMVNNYGDIIDEMPNTDVTDQTINEINAMSDEEYEAIYGGISKDETINNILEQAKIAKEDAEYYWGVVDTLEAEIALLTDEEIAEVMSSNNTKGFYDTYSQYIIPRFNDYKLVRTRWNGWCGPSILAWIYRGYNSNYNGKYLPLAGDSGFDNNNDRNMTSSGVGYYNFNLNDDHKSSVYGPVSDRIDGGLYKDIADACNIEKGSFGYEGASTPGQMSNAVDKVLKKKWNLTLAAPNNIRDGMPVVVLVAADGGLFDEGLHYIGAFGVKEKYLDWSWTVKVFRWKKTFHKRVCKTGQWVYVTDNGATTSSNGYLPYWRNDFIKITPKYCIK